MLLPSAYECFSIWDVENCGGCASTGRGEDCTKIKGANKVGCEREKCEVCELKGAFFSELGVKAYECRGRVQILARTGTPSLLVQPHLEIDASIQLSRIECTFAIVILAEALS